MSLNTNYINYEELRSSSYQMPKADSCLVSRLRLEVALRSFADCVLNPLGSQPKNLANSRFSAFTSNFNSTVDELAGLDILVTPNDRETGFYSNSLPVSHKRVQKLEPTSSILFTSLIGLKTLFTNPPLDKLESARLDWRQIKDEDFEGAKTYKLYIAEAFKKVQYIIAENQVTTVDKILKVSFISSCIFVGAFLLVGASSKIILTGTTILVATGILNIAKIAYKQLNKQFYAKGIINNLEKAAHYESNDDLFNTQSKIYPSIKELNNYRY